MKKNKNIKSSKKITNNRNNRRRYTGGKSMLPKWKQYGYETEEEYERDQQEQRDREIRDHEISRVLTNPIIEAIILIMNPDQVEEFEAHIRQNIRVERNIQSYYEMVHEFVTMARRTILNHDQRSIVTKIISAIQDARRANPSISRVAIMDIVARVMEEDIQEIQRRSDGVGNVGNVGGKKKYYKRYTAKNKSNRRK
jgi:hypothetical protein